MKNALLVIHAKGVRQSYSVRDRGDQMWRLRPREVTWPTQDHIKPRRYWHSVSWFLLHAVFSTKLALMMLKEPLSTQTAALFSAVHVSFNIVFCSATKVSLRYTFTFIVMCKYSKLTVLKIRVMWINSYLLIQIINRYWMASVC